MSHLKSSFDGFTMPRVVVVNESDPVKYSSIKINKSNYDNDNSRFEQLDLNSSSRMLPCTNRQWNCVEQGSFVLEPVDNTFKTRNLSSVRTAPKTFPGNSRSFICNENSCPGNSVFQNEIPYELGKGPNLPQRYFSSLNRKQKPILKAKTDVYVRNNCPQVYHNTYSKEISSQTVGNIFNLMHITTSKIEKEANQLLRPKQKKSRDSGDLLPRIKRSYLRNRSSSSKAEKMKTPRQIICPEIPCECDDLFSKETTERKVKTRSKTVSKTGRKTRTRNSRSVICEKNSCPENPCKLDDAEVDITPADKRSKASRRSSEKPKTKIKPASFNSLAFSDCEDKPSNTEVKKRSNSTTRSSRKKRRGDKVLRSRSVICVENDCPENPCECDKIEEYSRSPRVSICSRSMLCLQSSDCNELVPKRSIHVSLSSKTKVCSKCNCCPESCECCDLFPSQPSIVSPFKSKPTTAEDLEVKFAPFPSSNSEQIHKKDLRSGQSSLNLTNCRVFISCTDVSCANTSENVCMYENCQNSERPTIKCVTCLSMYHAECALLIKNLVVLSQNGYVDCCSRRDLERKRKCRNIDDDMKDLKYLQSFVSTSMQGFDDTCKKLINSVKEIDLAIEGMCNLTFLEAENTFRQITGQPGCNRLIGDQRNTPNKSINDEPKPTEPKKKSTTTTNSNEKRIHRKLSRLN